MNGGKRQRHHSKPSSSSTPSVCNTSSIVPPSSLPEDIILSILKRLPVKSILRFKCVSKDWLSLFSSPKFISIHREETSKNPLNHSFIVHSMNEDGDYHEISLLYVNYTEREHVSRFNPFHRMLEGMELVGSVNGLVCLAPPLRYMIILWNPALNLYKAIRLRKPDEDTVEVSLGLAYDSVNDDYKIIRIDDLDSSPQAYLSRAEVYSARSDSWERFQIDFPVVVSTGISEVTAKGIPYWTALANSQFNVTKSVLMYYDMQNGSFKHVPPPDEDLHPFNPYVEWKGNLGRIVSRGDFVDVWVYDEVGLCWNKISSHGPIGLNVRWPMQCSRDGMILAKTKEGKPVLYDHVTNRIKEFSLDGVLEDLIVSFTYTESLVTIKGMKKVEEQEEDRILYFS